MKIEIKVPPVGESVQEAVLAQWYKRDGDLVRKDEVLFVIETDKVTLEIAAEADGVLRIKIPEGETVAIGGVVGVLDTDAVPEKPEPEAPKERREEEPSTAERKPAAGEREPGVAPPPVVAVLEKPEPATEVEEEHPPTVLPPSVRRLVAEKGLDASKIIGTGPGGRITRGDVLNYLEESPASKGPEHMEAMPPEPREDVHLGAPRQIAERGTAAMATPPVPGPGGTPAGEESTTRKPMSRIRQRISERLLQAKQNTAMLTTFNEIDMSRLQAMRAQFKGPFREKYGVSLGIMSFFIKAAIAALKEYPQVNAFIDGKDILYHHYYHVGVAVGAERGLVVPVIRYADRLGFAEIEQVIVDFVRKIQENRLELGDLEGGTFTISNGGVYGSLLSTPILNIPQSGILGMHKIEDRAVVIDGQIVVRPMMYVALSYDHRIIDGREAVTFLKRIKECIENPERIMMEI